MSISQEITWNTPSGSPWRRGRVLWTWFNKKWNEKGIDGDDEDDEGEEEEGEEEEEEEEEEEDVVTLPQKQKAALKTKMKSLLIVSLLLYLSHHSLFFTRESPKQLLTPLTMTLVIQLKNTFNRRFQRYPIQSPHFPVLYPPPWVPVDSTESHRMLEFHSDSTRMVGISNSCGFQVEFPWIPSGIWMEFPWIPSGIWMEFLNLSHVT